MILSVGGIFCCGFVIMVVATAYTEYFRSTRYHVTPSGGDDVTDARAAQPEGAVALTSQAEYVECLSFFWSP